MTPTPTPKLRFVERDDETSWTPKTVRILQHFWEHTEWHAPGEWRDVPLEVEE